MSALSHIVSRRAQLRKRFDVRKQMAQIEETCIPSYLHRNPAAAGVAWMRLFAAVRFYRRYAPKGAVLDFGAASGELAHLLPRDIRYDFIEIDERVAKSLVDDNKTATRVHLNDIGQGQYAAIFALDSLEHNDDVGALLDKLIPALAQDGILILSGPTENWLYRLGRKIAGFSGEYHQTTIYNIEQEVAQRAKCLRRGFVPAGLPLFSLSCWR